MTVDSRVAALIVAAKALRQQVAAARSPDVSVRLKDFRAAIDAVDKAIVEIEKVSE